MRILDSLIVNGQRTRTSGSETLHDSLHWTYQPWNKIVCGKDPHKK